MTPVYEILGLGPGARSDVVHGWGVVVVGLLETEQEVNGVSNVLLGHRVGLEEVGETQQHLEDGAQAMCST